MATHPTQALHLPSRSQKINGRRDTGLTMVIDSGLGFAELADLIDSHGQYVDIVKLGFGTGYVNPDLTAKKTAFLRDANIPFYFGGTLFERFVIEDKLDEYISFIRHYGAKMVEVSDGTITLSPVARREAIAYLQDQGFEVYTEVGHKLAARQDELTPKQWAEMVKDDLLSGAAKVILEARESGKLGLATPDGALDQRIVDALVAAGIDQNHIMYEAPTKDLQTPLIKEIGVNVNLGNLSARDVQSLETLRLGLRSDTFEALLPEGASMETKAITHG